MIKTTTYIALAILLLQETGCANAGRHRDWENIDYSNVYRRAGQENDSGYTPPVGGCVDDDILSCR